MKRKDGGRVKQYIFGYDSRNQDEAMGSWMCWGCGMSHVIRPIAPAEIWSDAFEIAMINT